MAQYNFVDRIANQARAEFDKKFILLYAWRIRRQRRQRQRRAGDPRQASVGAFSLLI